MLKIFYIFSLILIFTCILTASVKAEYRDPTTMVNVNEQTNLFEESNEDWSAMQGQLDATKSGVLDGIKSNNGLDIITDKSSEEIKQSAADLSSIDAHDLNKRGAEEFAKNGLMKDIYIDFKRSLHKQSMLDAKQVVNAHDKLMDNLLGELKEIGVDCKTVKGAVEKEPAYYLQVESTLHKDTVYNQKFCEELRNTYNCTDSMSLTCKKKGMKWDQWEYRTIELGGHEVNTYHFNWFESVFWKKNKRRQKRYRVIMRVDTSTQQQIRSYIATKLKVNIEHISPAINTRISLRGDLIPANHGTYMHHAYTVGYSYRNGEEICEDWQENWTERCNLDLVIMPVSNGSGER